jgi:dipeptidyl aminopeptidase/acylaminoacyl peptidase
MGPKTGGGAYDIWTSSADGTNQVNLTNGLGGDFASWSDDGTKIVYGTSPPGDPNNEEIYWMNADGTNKTRVTNTPGRDSYPSFTPDAQQIAFMTERDGNREIYRCNLDGSGAVNLTNNPSTDQVPYYSPETGDYISFISYRDGDGEIYIMDADGSHQTRITNNPAQDVYPGWGEPSVVSSTFDVDAPTQQFTALMTCATNIEDDTLLLQTLPGESNVSESSIDGGFDSASHVATFTFPGFSSGALPDGNYRATIEGKSSEFYTLSGDADRNRTVDINDFNVLAANFGRAGKKFTEGNFDYSADSKVTILDFNLLAANFGRSVPAPAAKVATMSIGSRAVMQPTSQWRSDLVDLI